MDLIFADHEKTELGILRKFALDFEMSTEANKNTFEVELFISDYELKNGYLFYAEGTEIGGIVDETKIDTAKQIIYLSGRTWRGVLSNKIIQPPTGQNYYIVSGDANEIISQLISDCDLMGLFKVNSDLSGLTVSNYRFDRYTDLYSGIIKMLSRNGYKLKIYHDLDGFVWLSAVPIVDYEQEREITSRLFDFTITKTEPKANHMIGLGKGLLKDRLVVHRYLDRNGHISATKVITGMDERIETYEQDSEEDATELISKVDEKLLKLAVEDGMKIKSHDLDAEIGDRLIAYEHFTDTSIEQYVVDIILNIDETAVIKRDYKVGGTTI